MTNDFDNQLQVFFNRLGDAKHMVLATSKENRVTARMMSCVILDGVIYFQTDSTSLKYDQISANPLVALCADNIQIEGTAEFTGHPFDEQNRAFAAAFQQHHKGSFEAYSHLPNEIVVRVVPTQIRLWEYENGTPCMVAFDMENKVYAKDYSVGK